MKIFDEIIYVKAIEHYLVNINIKNVASFKPSAPERPAQPASHNPFQPISCHRIYGKSPWFQLASALSQEAPPWPIFCYRTVPGSPKPQPAHPAPCCRARPAHQSSASPISHSPHRTPRAPRHSRAGAKTAMAREGMDRCGTVGAVSPASAPPALALQKQERVQGEP